MDETLIKGLSHIAIAVKSLKDIDKWLSLFPVENISKYTSDEQKVNAIVVHLNNFDIEFLEPISSSSSIASFLNKNPLGGIHHVCFYVDNIDKSLLRIKDKGIRKITLKKTFGIIHGSPIAFLNPKDLSGVLVEFEELPKN
ncbi:MAG: VOC family protein [Gammaproteobacteria bacterium]